MSHVTTHILDTSRGRPVAGVDVELSQGGDDGWQVIAAATTDADGRCAALGPVRLESGVYRISFAVASYLGADAFYPEVQVTFRLDGAEPHYHVPLLLNPFGYSTYRGS